MIRLMNLSLIVEAAWLAVLVWQQQLSVVPMMCAWLAFDLLVGASVVLLDHFFPHDPRYRFVWMTIQPGVILTRVLAARECWKKLNGPYWIKTSLVSSVGVYVGRFHHWPKTVIDFEFGIIAICTAALAMVLYRAVQSARILTTEPIILQHATVMAGYFFLTALVYFVANQARDTAGIGIGIVATFSYACGAFVWARR